MARTSEEVTKRLLVATLLLLIAVVVWSVRLYFQTTNLQKEVGYTPTHTDTIWFAIQTVTTTGYGSLPQGVWDHSDGLKWLSMALMLFGVPAWIVVVGIVANLISAHP